MSNFDVTGSGDEPDPIARALGFENQQDEETRKPGHRLQGKFCPYCGGKVEADFDYCPGCGKDI